MCSQIPLTRSARNSVDRSLRSAILTDTGAAGSRTHPESDHGKEHPMMSMNTNQFAMLSGAAVATGAC